MAARMRALDPTAANVKREVTHWVVSTQVNLKARLRRGQTDPRGVRVVSGTTSLAPTSGAMPEREKRETSGGKYQQIQ